MKTCPACNEHSFTSTETKVCGPCQALVDAVAAGATHLLRSFETNGLYKRIVEITGAPAVEVAHTVLEEEVPGLKDAVAFILEYRDKIEQILAFHTGDEVLQNPIITPSGSDSPSAIGDATGATGPVGATGPSGATGFES